MNISATSPYQSLNTYQQARAPVTSPIEAPTQGLSPEDIYKGSGGNLISDKDGNISLTPQGQVNINNASEDAQTVSQEQTQEQKDEQRANGVEYIGRQSKKTQVEIYLSVAADSKVELGSDIPSVLESLRDVQKQNNAVEAYAQAQEKQVSGISPIYS